MIALPLVVLALAATPSSPVLLDFHADWCGPCKQLAPTIDRLVAEGYPVERINFDQRPDLVQKYRVHLVPALILVDGEREISRAQGIKSLTDLKQMFAQVGYTPSKSVARSAAPRSRDTTRMRDAPRLQDSLAAIPPRLGSSPGSSPARVGPKTPPAPKAPLGSKPAKQPPQPPMTLPERLLAASVRLKIIDGRGHSWGSGTIVDSADGEALILTCGHVFREGGSDAEIVVDLFGSGAPQGLRGELVDFDMERDVALVCVRSDYRFTVIPLATEDHRPRPGTVVHNVGCSHGEPPTLQTSRVKSLNKFLGPPNLQVAGQPVSGRSGGGLFNEQGELIAVCNAADQLDDEGLFAALPSVQHLLDRAGLTFVYRRDGHDPVESLARGERVPPSMAGSLDEAIAAPNRNSRTRATADVNRRPDSRKTASRETPPRTYPAPEKNSAAEPRLPPQRSPSRATAGERREVREVRPADRDKLNPEERAAVDALAASADAAEVICIVRSLTDPQAKSEIIILDRATPEFLKQLSQDRRVQDSRVLTSRRARATRDNGDQDRSTAEDESWRPADARERQTKSSRR